VNSSNGTARDPASLISTLQLGQMMAGSVMGVAPGGRLVAGSIPECRAPA